MHRQSTISLYFALRSLPQDDPHSLSRKDMSCHFGVIQQRVKTKLRLNFQILEVVKIYFL